MKLREIRLSKGMTQQSVSEYLDCAPSVYCRYETGDRIPSVDVLIKLSKCFGVSVDYIDVVVLVLCNSNSTYNQYHQR